MNTNKILAFMFFLAFVSSATSADVDWAVALQKTDEVFSDLDSVTAPGCAVGIIHSGQYVLAKGYGMANLEHGIPISSKSVFRTGSLSKQFTAAAIALLAERGELDLDGDIRNYLPDLSDYGTKVTIRQMIHHISGIPDYEGGVSASVFLKEDGSAFRFGNEDYYTIQEFYDHAKRVELENEPEKEFSYSNTAYFFLSQVVEKVTGETLKQFSESEIFTNLGMQNSFFNDNVNEIVPNRADGYKYTDTGVFEIYMTNLSWVGDGGFYTTIEDFIKWDRNFYNNRIGINGARFIDILESPHPFFEGHERPYAWGMNVIQNRGQKVIFHAGSWVGFQSFYMRYPDLELSFIVMCNADNTNPGRRIIDIRDSYLAALDSSIN